MSKRKAKQRKRTSKEPVRKRPVTMAKRGTEKPQKKPAKQGQIMKLSKAKDLFRYGVLNTATIIPKPMSNGWLVMFMTSAEGPKILETDRGEEREFKSIDTAFKAAEAVGFEVANIRRKRDHLHSS